MLNSAHRVGAHTSAYITADFWDTERLPEQDTLLHLDPRETEISLFDSSASQPDELGNSTCQIHTV